MSHESSDTLTLMPWSWQRVLRRPCAMGDSDHRSSKLSNYPRTGNRSRTFSQ